MLSNALREKLNLKSMEIRRMAARANQAAHAIALGPQFISIRHAPNHVIG